MTLVIIDYGSGNLRSCAKAFERVAGTQKIIVSADPKALADASHIVLPGVGAFADCMQGLRAVSGMLDALSENVIQKQKHFLGICVGMQLMFERGFEHGEHQGLGWIQGDVVGIRDSGFGIRQEHPQSLKVPHMGWNELTIPKPNPLFKGIKNGAHAYFVHSYHAQCTHAEDVAATTNYGGTVTAAVARGNLFGTQFHPEKSQETGLAVLTNFLAL
jgi:imidazole glycerol-phosphate synthase subunit HisH